MNKWLQFRDFVVFKFWECYNCNQSEKEGEWMPFIKVDGLRKVYKIGSEKVIALNKINLSIEKGEICCILGTSGSGKSTFLNMLAGLEKPSKGKIIIADVDVAKLTEKQLAKFRQENTGFVFQSYNLLANLTAVENVSLPLMFKGIAKSKRNKISEKMLKAVGLDKRMNHRPNQMSGGQQQRVGIARAFVARPNIVFADEPTGNLDTKTTKEVMELMVRMCRKYNMTLILVTHDRDIAKYSDRIVHLIDGDIDSDTLNESIVPKEVNQNSNSDSEVALIEDINDTYSGGAENKPTHDITEEITQ